MSNLQERLRCALRRNFKGETPSRGYIEVKKGQRFKDHRGATVIVQRLVGGYVVYLRSGKDTESQMPLRLFSKKFTEVRA
ncbi:DUF4222 domain-containing protein [Hafnia alvei]|uniref:DUF4222 domain-containing protein n=1 Tax=Hafnia alvei TaxID=569 RepID=UPI00345DA6F9